MTFSHAWFLGSKPATLFSSSPRSSLKIFFLKGNFFRQVGRWYWLFERAQWRVEYQIRKYGDETFWSITVGDSSKGTTCGGARKFARHLASRRRCFLSRTFKLSFFFPSFITCIHICKGTFYCVYVSREKFSVAAATVMSQKRKRIRREYNRETVLAQGRIGK